MKKMDPTRIVRTARPKIHHSALERIKFNIGGYSPIVLPDNYAVVGPDGKISDLGTAGNETKDQAKNRIQAQEFAWDMVWLQRCNYYVTLALLVLLASMPWLPYPIMSATDCQVSLQGADNQCVPSVLWFVSYIIDFIGNFLPAFLQRWLDTFKANPLIFALIVAAIFFALKVSSRLDLETHDRMRAIWDNPDTVTKQPSKLTSLRKSRVYQGLLRAVTQYVLPIIFAFALQLIILAALVVFAIKTWM